MKKTSNTFTGKRRARHRRPVLMAYTLNNTQPVICTLVADQPYFYMEEENVMSEDDILEEEFAAFENDLADLKKRMEACERVTKMYERDPQRRLEEFAAEAITICEAKNSQHQMLQPADRIVRAIGRSRSAKALLEFAQANAVYIVESELVPSARYDRDGGRILVHPDIDETSACLLAVRELRRHWQHRKGVLINPLTFHPDQAVLINRALNADLSASMIRAAWEMQLAGDRAAWEFIELSSMADLGRAFAREAFVDFRSLASGKASSAVFESWFLSERCRHQDKKLIQAMLADHQGYVFANVEASRSVSIELIMALGEQPFGKNYLAPYAQMIMEDPVFTEVRDRSNANFLWFIKFERSFRETEQALQSEEGTISGEGVLPAAPFTEQGENTHGTNSIIIPLGRDTGLIHRGGRVMGRRSLDGAHLESNVIHVRFGNGESA
jgi:hypothetical protein